MSERTIAVGDVRVLVVGDSDRVDAARETLESAFPDSAVLTARTAADALERLEERDVHCVVCDLEAGTTTLETIRERADVPIVAIAEESTATGALEAGATDVLPPSASPALAASRVGNAVERYRLALESDTERYRRILEASDAPVVVLDGTGELRYASPALEAETGFTPAELERRSLSRFVHPDDREAAGKALAAVASGSTGETRRERYRLRHADGSWAVHGVTLTNRLEDPAVEGVVVTVSRATAAAADPVSDSVERLEGAFVALGPRWEVTYANEEAERLFSRPDAESAGPAVDDPTGTVLWDLLPGSIRGTFYERLHEARASDSPVSFEVEHPSLETWFDVEAHPSASGLTLYAREATATAADADRRERRSLLESALDALDDGVLVLDGATVEVANAAAFDLLDADVIVGRDLADLVAPDLADAIAERADSAVVRRAEPIRTTLRADEADEVDEAAGTPIAVSVVPLPGDERVVCVLSDETDRRELWAALSTLREAGATLLAAETVPEAAQSVVDAAVDVLGADLVGWYRRADETLEPVAYATAGTASPPPLPTLEREGTTLGDAADAANAAVRDGGDLERFLAAVGVRADRVLTAPLDGRGVVFATATDPETFDERAVAFLESLSAMGAVTVARIEGESAVRERERELARRTARYDRLADLGERKRAIGRRLVRADDRETIETAVCEELASIDWIVLAWIGEVDVAAETVTPRAAAGDESYLESVTVDVDPDGEPAGRAAASREPVVVENVVRAGSEGSWRRAALERELGSILSVALSVDGYVSGTLAVYADRASAFDEVTRDVFVDLGETVAFALHAVETRRALLADGVTELELLTDATDDPLAALARRAGCTLEVGTVIPRSPDRSTVFVTVEDAPAGAVREAADSIASIESAEPVAEDEDEASPIELVVAEPTVASTLADAGGVVRSVAAAGDRTRLLVDVPQGTDVRSFVERVEASYPRTELVARRERERPVRTRRGFRAELREALTDRQRRTLEAAYYGGFFEWPRERTGEEVARSLGVSQPTFNRHYRAAERKLFALLFDDETGEDEP